ncbi:hypothetical protein SAMN05216559_2098 [Halomicrobium zhouii]|uniref:Lipoprotein n=1 Tax=Halomicrobium zhouii TaxID=767519 RepID=A0A1I6L6B4_9EURY|nr:Hvo_1808 family surface protein [Halomicrobium zhouii]SFR98780.1 hypothetical protein SAMN05216559_2098 [Halomicrobium zhouii]
MLRAVLLALLLVLAGCQAPGFPGSPGADSGTEPGDRPTTTDSASSADSTGNDRIPTGGEVPEDPESDRLGWENGYWHNESVAVTPGDGYNESELDAVVARSMARMELVRGLEFEEDVPVTVIDRTEYRNESGGNHSEALTRFDNAKFEALFLVGERDDSIETQESTRGESVLGYYSPSRDEIVVVSESETPRLDGEGTLAHELVHALQDQHFDLAADPVRTRDAHQGRNGLIEGDASFAERRYQSHCGEAWECLGDTENGDDEGGGEGSEDAGEQSDGAPGHLGIQVLMYFPYSDGPGFVESLYDDGGWDAVNDAYEDRPDGSPEVIYPDRYPEWEPADVELRDRSSDQWERVEPPNRPNYAVPGQSAIAATLAYTLADEYNDAAVVRPTDVINYRANGSVDSRDPFDYDVGAAAGWAGGKMYVYENDAGELGYVWRTKWESPDEAREFASSWTAVVKHWGGERVGDNVWEIRDSQFADAVRIRQRGDTVTVVNAPDRDGLSEVHDA